MIFPPELLLLSNAGGALSSAGNDVVDGKQPFFWRSTYGPVEQSDNIATPNEAPQYLLGNYA